MWHGLKLIGRLTRSVSVSSHLSVLRVFQTTHTVTGIRQANDPHCNSSEEGSQKLRRYANNTWPQNYLRYSVILSSLISFLAVTFPEFFYPILFLNADVINIQCGYIKAITMGNHTANTPIQSTMASFIYIKKKYIKR